MKIFVISGINLYEGGPLSVYKDCLDALLELEVYKEYHIVAFVNRKTLFMKYSKYIELIELPLSRKNYLYRLYYEYCYFWEYSKNRNIYIWFSLHDITPNVLAKRRYVYCHNPSPFMENKLSIVKYSPITFMMSLFYRYLYAINIKKNTKVIIQQEWIRNEFEKMYGIHNIIVARPNFEMKNVIQCDKDNDLYTFIFPSFPRAFKNFEIICKACKLIGESKLYQVYITLAGDENRYAKALYKKYKNIKSIQWIGVQEREKLFNLYSISDCMIFPSKLETWGLPISEFRTTEKSILLADLPYAHETIGEYKKVSFFEPDNTQQLAEKMIKLINGEMVYEGNHQTKYKGISYDNWKSLINYLIE